MGLSSRSLACRHTSWGADSTAYRRERAGVGAAASAGRAACLRGVRTAVDGGTAGLSAGHGDRHLGDAAADHGEHHPPGPHLPV